MVTEPSTLGDLIRERRLARGLSLGQLATAVGRTAATVRSWERGQHLPAADVVDRLAMTLGVDADVIEDLMVTEPPSLTVVADEPEDDAVTSESTSVSGAALVETAEGSGDDDTAEVGEVASAPAAVADEGVAFSAATADELGVMPKIRIEPPAAASAVVGPEPAISEPRAAAADAGSDTDVAEASGVDAEVMPEVETPDIEDGPWFEEEITEELEALDVPAPVPVPAEPDRALIDEPTEPIGPPIAAPEPVAVGHSGVAVRAETLQEPVLPPFLAPLRAIFDPHKKWLYWIRGALTVVVMLVMLLVLAWAAGELFDGLGAVLDTIESNETLSDLAPLN